MENMSGSMNEKMVSQEHDTERTINRKDNKAKNEALTYIRDYRVMTNFKYRLITNILIPLLAILASMLIDCSKTVWARIGVNIWSIFDIIMISSIVSVGSLNIFRYMDLGMYIYLLALIVIFPAIAGSIAVLIYGGTLKFIAPLLAVALVCVIAATYYHMVVRIRRSYVDV